MTLNWMDQRTQDDVLDAMGKKYLQVSISRPKDVINFGNLPPEDADSIQHDREKAEIEKDWRIAKVDITSLAYQALSGKIDELKKLRELEQQWFVSCHQADALAAKGAVRRDTEK